MTWPSTVDGNISSTAHLQVSPKRTEFMTNHNYWIYMDMPVMVASSIGVQDWTVDVVLSSLESAIIAEYAYDTIDVVLPYLISAVTADNNSPITGSITLTLSTLASNPNSTSAASITGSIDVIYQYVTADIDIKDYKINQTLPHLSAQSYGGGYTLVTLPNITALLTGTVGLTGNVNVNIPSMQSSLGAISIVLGDINSSTPHLTSGINGYLGVKTDINITLANLSASITPYMGISGAIIVTLPSDEVYLVMQNTGSVSIGCHALTYVDEF